MTKYYFTRHGESYANADRIFAGIVDSPLTEKGRDEARAEGKRLEREKRTFSLIISSPLSRAYETATIIAEAVRYTSEILTLELLTERSFGALAGKPWSSVEDEASDLFVEFGGESIAELSERVVKALDCIRELSSGQQAVLIVGHGSWYQMANTLLHGKKAQSFLESMSIPNNKIVEFRL